MTPEPGTYSRHYRHRHSIIMAGFNSIVAMHVRVSAMIVDRLPRPPPFPAPRAAYARSSSTTLPSFLAFFTFPPPSLLSDQHFLPPPQYQTPSQQPRLPSVSPSTRSATSTAPVASYLSPYLKVSTTLQMIETGIGLIRQVLDKLPIELRFPRPLRNDDTAYASSPDPYQSMRANIYLTGIFLQSLVVESYVARELHTRAEPRTWTASGEEGSYCDSKDNSDTHEPHLRWNDRSEIWRLREGIARDLQHLLQSFPMSVFETTGAAMTVKIRRVAATLLEHTDTTTPPDEAEKAERRRKEYLDYFVQVLAELDHSPNASFGFAKSRS